MKTRVIVTLEDNNTMTTYVEGEPIAQVVIGMLRFGQLCAEQDATLALLLTKVESSPLVAEILKKMVSIQNNPVEELK
jgi:hypothetical protein